MSIKDEYLFFRDNRGLKTNNFNDRVILQKYLRDNIDDIWKEKPGFTNGGLLSNYMSRFAIGFAYYDCKPTSFCKKRCYGLPISGIHDYYMLRLGVITSESFKIGDQRFCNMLKNKIKSLNLRCLKIGHWGDAVLKQVPIIAELAKDIPNTIFWWYTRKKEIAIAANEFELPNLRAYLSLDPCTDYPGKSEYSYGITYLLGQGLRHKQHEDILKDNRLVAIFPLKKGSFIEDIDDDLTFHPKICKEKQIKAEFGGKGKEICLSCSGRCNYSC